MIVHSIVYYLEIGKVMITEQLSNKYYGNSLKIVFVHFTAHSLTNSNLGTMKGPSPIQVPKPPIFKFPAQTILFVVIHTELDSAQISTQLDNI